MYTKLAPLAAIFVAALLPTVDRVWAAEPSGSCGFAVSGAVAEKLSADSTVVITAAGARSLALPVKNLPISIPWQRFLRTAEGTRTPVGAYVEFRDSANKRIAGVLLSADMFDKPRNINLLLKRPETFVKPARPFGSFGFRYHATISRRMQYSDVPKWDGEKQAFVAPSPPILQIYNVDTNELLQQSEMRSMCYGHGWTLLYRFPDELEDNTKLRAVVLHDTGDLFGTLKSECSFTYRKVSHGATAHRRTQPEGP